jgi:hypothetical protein
MGSATPRVPPLTRANDVMCLARGWVLVGKGSQAKCSAGVGVQMRVSACHARPRLMHGAYAACDVCLSLSVWLAKRVFWILTTCPATRQPPAGVLRGVLDSSIRDQDGFACSVMAYTDHRDPHAFTDSIKASLKVMREVLDDN